MSTEPTQTPAPEAEIIFGFGGRALRRIDQTRLFKTGDHLVNKHGQALWEMIGFHPKGVRVLNWPHGEPVDWSWETVYGFYERVPSKDVPDPERNIGDPAMIKDMTASTVADATGLRPGPCLDLAKQLYADGKIDLPPGLKA